MQPELLGGAQHANRREDTGREDSGRRLRQAHQIDRCPTAVVDAVARRLHQRAIVLDTVLAERLSVGGLTLAGGGAALWSGDDRDPLVALVHQVLDRMLGL